MRILVAANPNFGHFLPLVPLAVTLQERGHDVLVATGPSFTAHATAHGLPAVGVGRDLSVDDMLAVLPEIFEVAPEDQDAYARPRVFVELKAHNVVDDLLALVRDWRPDLIVREGAEFGSWAVAERLSIVHVAVNVGTATTTQEWDMFAAPWFLDLGRRVGLDALTADSLYRHGVLSFELAGYNDWSDTPTAQVYRPADVVLATASTTGAEGLEALDALDALDDRPLIYVTLGTEFFHPDLMRPLIAALGGGEWNVVVTTGPQGAPSEIDPGRSHVVVAGWLPQDAVLDRAAAVVCHGGAGTTIGALLRGLPVVCLPLGADQFEHARRVRELGVGIDLAPDQRSQEQVHDAVATVLSDERCRSAARELATATARLPDVHAAASHLEQL